MLGSKSRILVVPEVLVEGIAVSPSLDMPGAWISREGIIFSEDQPVAKAATEMIHKLIHPEKKVVRVTYDHGDLL
jgi:hypothetical protein